MITAQTLLSIAPRAPKHVGEYVAPLSSAMIRYGITTPRRIAMFLAQIAHESDEFNALEEYASGKAYEGRKDLGNVRPGDGVKYKGRGFIMTTGRVNYAALVKVFGVDFVAFPELLEKPHWAAMAAAYYWASKKLNEFADLPDTWRSATKKYTPYEYITYRINGGLNGMQHRRVLLTRAKRALGVG